MSKALSEFAPVLGRSDLWSAQKGSLRCTALRLRDGSLCLYSPVLGLGDVARHSLASLGDVSYLLAPNHYHHKGLTEYVKTFPNARLLCSDKARPRLEKQTGLAFGDLSQSARLLPDECEFVAPDGLKTGEVWIIQQTQETCVWIVCDAFKGPLGKAGSGAVQVDLLGTFPTYGIRDKANYSTWVETILAAKPPNTIVPCHGSIVENKTLTSDIKSLLG